MQEFGFYHPTRGYFQVIGGNPDASDFESGTISVPLRPSADHNWKNGAWVHTPPPEPTPEELRAQMPRKSMVEFRVALRSVKVVQREGETELDGIYEADILEKISLIADRALQAEARDYFLYAGYIDRSNPWVDILGGIFGLSPEQIDTFWLA